MSLRLDAPDATVGPKTNKVLHAWVMALSPCQYRDSMRKPLSSAITRNAEAGESRPGLGPAGCRRGIFDLAREQSHETKGRARSKQRSSHFLTDADPACMEVMFILACPRIGQPEELTVTRGQPHRNRAWTADCGRSSEGFQPTRGKRGPLAQRCSGGQRLQKVSAMPTLMRVYQPLCNSFCAQ